MLRHLDPAVRTLAKCLSYAIELLRCLHGQPVLLEVIINHGYQVLLVVEQGIHSLHGFKCIGL